MREPDLNADITERLRYHIELLAASGYPAKLQRDALAEILTLREALARSEADPKGEEHERAGGSTG